MATDTSSSAGGLDSDGEEDKSIGSSLSDASLSSEASSSDVSSSTDASFRFLFFPEAVPSLACFTSSSDQ